MPSSAPRARREWLAPSASASTPHNSLSQTDAPLDAVGMLLESKRSASTRRAYAGDLRCFALFLASCDHGSQTPKFTSDADSGALLEGERIGRFLLLSAPEMALVLARWKGSMLRASLSEATVNRRLAAVRSLLRFAFRLGLSACDGRSVVEGERARAYRDTRGITLEQMRLLLEQPTILHSSHTVHGLRDAALLRLLCENVLRRGEAHLLDVADFDAPARSLLILGKGAGTQKQVVTLSPAAVQVLADYLRASGHRRGALFRCLDHRPDKRNGRLSANGIYKIVRAYGSLIGVENLAPHKLRHAGITAALDATGGDVRRVQKLSRHASIATLMIYDDFRRDAQGEVTNLLSDLLQQPEHREEPGQDEAK